jgi:RNA polymerase sigma-70 factor (ECF subfamily)
VLTGRLAVAEEMAQDAFLAAFGAWERIRSFDRPDAWVRRVVANKCVSAWRRGATEARLVARLRRERVAEPVIPEPDHDVLRAIRALPGRQRQVLALIVLEDRSVADVAQLLGCSEDSVRTHLRRGRAALAARVRESERGEGEEK